MVDWCHPGHTRGRAARSGAALRVARHSRATVVLIRVDRWTGHVTIGRQDLFDVGQKVGLSMGPSKTAGAVRPSSRSAATTVCTAERVTLSRALESLPW